jgi:hypothetical protein
LSTGSGCEAAGDDIQVDNARRFMWSPLLGKSMLFVAGPGFEPKRETRTLLVSVAQGLSKTHDVPQYGVEG